MAMALLSTKKRNDYLYLLNIADNARMGKSQAILFSFKLGYLQGKSAHKPDVYDLDFQNFISDTALKLQKALVTLQTAIEAYLLYKTDLTESEMMAIGGNASNICDPIIIADDYVHSAKKMLEGILE